MNISHSKAWGAALAGAVAAVVAGPVQADLIGSFAELSAGALVQQFDDSASYTTGVPRVQIGASLGTDLGVTASNGTLYFGAPFGAWSLGDNGEWTGAAFVGVDGAGNPDAGVFPTLRFDFGGNRTSQVGAFMNFDPGFQYGGLPLPLYIAAYDVNGTLIEEYNLPVFTPADGFGNPAINQGAFYGIKLANASIASFEVSGPYAVVDNLAFVTPVPEPSAYALLALGLGLTGFVVQRRRRAQERADVRCAAPAAA